MEEAREYDCIKKATIEKIASKNQRPVAKLASFH
jgi:hypothetical protein